MSSQGSFGSNMLFQTINDDLNASLATADELSKEFSSLMQEASSSNNNNKPAGAQTSSSTFRNQSQSSGSPSLSSTRLSSGSSSVSKPFSSNQTYYSSFDSGLSGGGGSRNAPSPPVASFGSSALSGSALPSPSYKPFSPSPVYFNPIESSLSGGSRKAPSPPVSSNSPHSSPKMQRSPRPQQRPNDNFTFKQATGSQRPDSPSYFERSPQGLIGYKERTSSPSRKDQSPRSSSPHSLSPSDSSMMGVRSPRHDKGPSPLTFTQYSSTLPRNLYSSGQTDEVLKRQKSPNKWNETDLDAGYERKPQHTYDKAEWLRSPVPVPIGNWRESNLDGPPLAPNPKKDLRMLPQQGYGSLPRNARIAVPPDVSSQAQFHREMKNSPYYSQPLSRISVPPNSSPFPQRRALPLSVILRIQNPYFGAMTPQPSSVLEEERDFPPYQPPVPMLQEFFHQPGFQPQQQPPVYSDVLHSGDVDAEIERLGSGSDVPAASEPPASPGAGGEAEQAVPPAPRPLSPTRLQPVMAPEARSQELPDSEELLRIRAEIPRPLKRRGSVDPTQPQNKASHYQRNQYKYAISNFLRRDRSKGGEQRSESGSSSDGEDTVALPPPPPPPQASRVIPPEVKNYPTILRKSRDRKSSGKRARLNPLVLLLDGALVGELDTVKKAVQEMTDPSQPNDEGITGLHNAVCGGHHDVVDFLVRIGVNVSSLDSHGWTPLHCAASCNDRGLCEFLVRNGAAVMARTHSDGATAVQKCDPYLGGFDDCEGYLRGVEEAMGVENSGVLYALWSHQAQAPDELSFKDGDMVTILQKPEGSDWWWASLYGREGFVPSNYFGLFPKVRPKSLC